MRYRRFRTADGRFLDALLTVDGDAFSVPAESHQRDHEAGYGVTPLEVVDGDVDPWDGAGELVHAPERLAPVPPEPPLTEAELVALRALIANAAPPRAPGP